MLSTLEAHKKTARLLAKPWEKPDLADTFVDATTRNTLCKPEMQLMAEHRDKYTAFTRTKRTAKHHQKTTGYVSTRACPMFV